MKSSLNKVEIPKEVFEKLYLFQNGGKYDEFVGRTQMEMEGPTNVELENNEWILDSQGLRQVKGDTHEKGGVDLQLEDGTLILSDHLKIDRSKVKELNKEYDVNISVKDTYAKALEKIYSKVGLNTLQKEHAELAKKTEKQAQIEDEATAGANLTVLSKQMQEIEKKKAPLLAKATKAFHELYDLQESGKKGESPKAEFQDGGIVEMLRTPAPAYTDLQREQILGRYASHQTPETQEQLRRLLEQNRLVYNTGTLSRLDSRDLGLPTHRQQQSSSGTFGNLNQEQIQGYVFNDTYRQMRGNNLDYGNSSVMDEWNPLIRQAYQDQGINYRTSIQGNNDNAFGTITSEQPGIIQTISGAVEGNFDLNKYRGLTEEEKEQFATQIGRPKEEIDNIASNPTNVQINVRPDGLNEWNRAYLTGVGQPPTETPTEVQEGMPEPSDDTEGSAPQQTPQRTGLLNRPSSEILPVDPMQAHLKVNRRYERADAIGMSPEAQLTELNRLNSRAQETLDLMPASQRAAVVANLLGTTSQQSNQIISQVQQANMQELNRVQNVNNQIQMAEENAGAQDALNYEQRQLLAQAKTDADLRNYFNAIQRQQQQNFRDVEDVNKMNYLFRDFQLTDRGYEAVGTGGGFSFNGQTLSPEQQEVAQKALEEDAKKKTKKKFGGRFGK